MKKSNLLLGLIALIVTATLFGCSAGETSETKREEFTAGIMLSDVGLGDQSFSDAAFAGLLRLRNEESVLFDYRELQDTKTYEAGITSLVEAGHDLVIGVGFMVQEDLEKVAKKYPNQQFLLIDAVSELDNVTSLTFKEEEGSFLAGAVAALTTKTNTIGFVGGADVPLIHKFEKGYVQGAKSINPDIAIQIKYAGSFSDDKLGATIANEMITEGADVLYAAAGFTGVGALQEAEKFGKYAIGVDSDQYYFAEQAVITSMLKKIDNALFQTIKSYKENGEFSDKHLTLGIKEKGIGLAPIRVISSTQQLDYQLQQLKDKLKKGEIKIQ